ncbi:MAG TPA: zf-HC2 domain-containing protein, partial [Candidatus Limnocylindria bacterium]|nr:zf-HC2 domain-containing protein [Candidatus Limnocylindria bacterium]
MGNPKQPHAPFQELSALADGELEPIQAAAVQAHVSQCATCASVLDTFVSIDSELQQPPVLACESALTLLSARHDGEADPAEATVAERHLAACAACQARVAAWSRFDAALHSLPAGVPSQRTDAAIAALGRAPQRRARRPVGAALRGAAALATAVALAVAGLSRGGGPVTFTPSLASNDRLLVATAQQIVLNPATSTLYVIDQAPGAIRAQDATTNALKKLIMVGGRPTALALDPLANKILVLDSAEKRVTEIDGASNTVVGSTTMDVAGTPTSIRVDPATSKIIVTSVQPSAAPSHGGTVSVLDSGTKKVEAIRDVAIAPMLAVVDPAGARVALVSGNETSVVDEGYRVLARLPGGVAAAFARGTGVIAVLSAAGDNAVVSFAGDNAPASLSLSGRPRAMVALPDGGFLVLVEVGGHGRVVRVGADGKQSANVELAISGRDLVYDEANGRFSVADGGIVSSAAVPGTAVAVASPSP